MKLKILQFIFALSICFSFFSFVSAQKNSVALKFDEFDDASNIQFYPFEELTLSQRIERFIRQIKQERGIKVYLIYYRARKENNLNSSKSSSWAVETSSEIRYKTKLKDEDIISIDGGYKERNTIEYWIVPKNAEPPKPTPSFDKSESFDCPSINVYADALQFDKTKSINFSVSDYYLDKIENLKFLWKVSAGKIIEGQGQEKIKVDLTDTNVKRITAFVEVDGLPYPCEKVGFSTIEVGKKPYLVVEAERYNSSELSAMIDGFMMQIYDDPTLKGYIIIYAGRNGGTKEMVRAIVSVRRMFAFRRYDLSRVTILRGGFREYNTVDMWVVPEGAELPTATPTVNEKFVVLPKQAKKSSTKLRR